MLKTKENKIIFFSVLVLACLVYINFITGYFSIDSPKIINLGYDGYAINYSFWDGRIVMGILCMIANAINLNLKVFYIILICLSMLILSFTVLKLYTVISKYKKTGVKEKIILAVLGFCYIFNFTTINSMEFVECIVMSLSILLYILVAENIVIKKDVKKVILYTFLAGICYQGTINMLFITAILFFFLEYKKGEKIDKKKIIFSIIGVIIAVILNVVLKKVMEIIIGSTVCGERMSGDILGNITKIIQGMYFLIIESLYLFPKYAYISFNASIVAFSSSEKQARFAKIFSISSLDTFFGIKFSTSIEPSVRVPVLSKHKVSTLAKVSIQYRSCTNTLDLESLITLTAKTVLVSRTNPSGIIPIIAATVWTTESLREAPCKKYWLKNKASPIGIIITVKNLIILFNDPIISDFTFLTYLAPLEILEV